MIPKGTLSGLSGTKAKTVIMGTLLGGMSIMGPMVAYAGVDVVYPGSVQTADVDESPPIVFSAGSDHSKAQNVGFAGAFVSSENGAQWNLTFNGLSDGKVTIDDAVNVSVESAVTSYKMKVSSALGTGISPTTFKVRIWNGTTAPTGDSHYNVCAVLDLTAAQGTESTNSCDATDRKVQVIYELPEGQTTESDTVTVQPSSITV